jgi:hypothetical protein
LRILKPGNADKTGKVDTWDCFDDKKKR